MKNNVAATIAALLPSLVLIPSFQNCTGGSSELFTQASKNNVMSANPVLPASTSSTPSLLTENFSLLCSVAQSQSMKSNLITTASVKLDIVNPSNNAVICELNGDFKNEIISGQAINVDISSCGLLAGTYDAYLVDASLSLVPESGNFVATTDEHAFQNFSSNALSAFSFNVSASGTATVPASQASVNVLYDLNSQQSGYSGVDAQAPFNGSSTSATQALCTQRASPLIISLDNNPQPLDLTSTLDGILFNILGENSAPISNAPKLISWFPASQNQDYFFLVLPDENGQVHGIDQMFGNNTLGPDGKFADNGYLALAKYDLSKSGNISAKDAIYGRLRLWKDVNHDGIATADELFTLEEKSVVSIDLNYDSNYREADQYGNLSLYKSVVKTSDGNMHLIFDLWFVYKSPQAAVHTLARNE